MSDIFREVKLPPLNKHMRPVGQMFINDKDIIFCVLHDPVISFVFIVQLPSSDQYDSRVNKSV